eukprot:11441394-Karenia_brevis.AAC.1
MCSPSRLNPWQSHVTASLVDHAAYARICSRRWGSLLQELQFKSTCPSVHFLPDFDCNIGPDHGPGRHDGRGPDVAGPPELAGPPGH